MFNLTQNLQKEWRNLKNNRKTLIKTKLLQMRKYDGNRKYDKKRFWIKNRGIMKSEIL